MAFDLAGIHSLSDFQRNTRGHIRKLKKSGKPAVLTVNGERKLLFRARIRTKGFWKTESCWMGIRSITRGLEQGRRGKGRSMREFVASLAKEHGISLT